MWPMPPVAAGVLGKDSADGAWDGTATFSPSMVFPSPPTGTGTGAGWRLSPPHPVTRYCRPMLTTLETTQYTARPLGKARVQNPNMSGHNQVIIRVMDC